VPCEQPHLPSLKIEHRVFGLTIRTLTITMTVTENQSDLSGKWPLKQSVCTNDVMKKPKMAKYRVSGKVTY